MTFRLLRFLFFLAVLLTLGRGLLLPLYATLPPGIWLPRGLMTFFVGPLLPWDAAQTIYRIWQISLVFAALGLGGRLTLGVVAVLGTLLIGQAQSYGYFTHIYMPVLLSLWVWLLFPKDPFRIIQFIFSLVFFGAGLSKLRIGGWEWLTSESLFNIMIRASLWYQDINFSGHKYSLTPFLLENQRFLTFLPWMIVGLELMALPAWFSRKLAIWVIPSLLGFQICIYLTILVNFQTYAPLYIAWIPYLFLFKKPG